MPITTPEQYSALIGNAKEKGYALPAINVTSSQTLNAALDGFAEAESDGIIQISLGTALYLSGNRVRDRVAGTLALAAYAHEVAARYPVSVAIHTDHCPEENLDDWVRPLLAHSAERVERGLDPLVQSHMWDGSAVALGRNLDIAAELLEKSRAAKTMLEIEVGVIGGEEDGISGEIDEKLYTTIDDARAVIAKLGSGEDGEYLTALTFGNVHGVYKPGGVHLRPGLLGEIQATIGAETGLDKPFSLVFHGGSGSSAEDIAAAVAHGVVKMNIDTDTQYAFTRSIAGHMFAHYDSVLKIDGEVGNKKHYDPRSWGKPAELAMAARVVEAARQLGSAGRAMR
ncbi:class II fructose-bisphosphate aldolase [Paeniglutamicibacter cryotolerans]|uniref:Fructose-bisphosphate aldolase n=1 Tax=Paeniglutamicibacter cryotolerans TaxID=670079 RepID=A0A839QGX4_9MICC|nr:class II fructose-bisphosphate aldolase [Paeniglutamicibacter cryotolerans]MBB2995150.1 fructose-bisphosphate aldolase class II [Paeniglutamicibacter cryotolerans]